MSERAKAVGDDGSDSSRLPSRLFGDYPLLGHDRPWDDVDGELCLLVEHSILARVEGSLVTAAATYLPYAALVVKTFDPPRGYEWWVVHRKDCQAICFALDREDREGEEVVVSWDSSEVEGLSDFFAAVVPRLTVRVHPKGWWTAVHEKRFNGLSAEPLAIWEPFER